MLLILQGTFHWTPFIFNAAKDYRTRIFKKIPTLQFINDKLFKKVVLVRVE